MDGFWDSLGKWFNEKTGSPLYFTYIGFFLAWNWQFFHVLLIEDESKFDGPAIEYVQRSMYFSVENILAGSPAWIITAINWISNLTWHIVPPAVFTILAILYLPRIQRWALGRFLNSSYERKRMVEEKQREFNSWLLSSEERKEQTLEKIATVRRKQSKQREAIKKTMTKEESWVLDFDRFRATPLFEKLEQITNVVYQNSGLTQGWNKNGTDIVRLIDTDMLAFAHASGLISLAGKGRDEKIELTDKGRFFVSEKLKWDNLPF